MYTHLYYSKEDAKKIFEALGPKPGETNQRIGTSFEDHYAQVQTAYLRPIAGVLHRDDRSRLFVIKFGFYLTEIPLELVEMDVMPVMAEIVRFNSAPTRAIAGYYRDEKTGMEAMVERVFPTQRVESRKPVALYAQNITVSGMSLPAVHRFNSELSMGHYNRHLVDRME